MSVGKIRIDKLLVQLGLVPSIEKGQALIMAGEVLVDDVPVEKAGALVSSAASVRLRSTPSRFVGRGGEKIDPAFDFFKIELTDKVALDVGASTGGFTDCMLARGARRVYALDVGYNQLDARLRADPRVVVMERTHARDLTPEMLDPTPELMTVDVSFISLRSILSPVIDCLSKDSIILLLVKPQFELPTEMIEKGGVVSDKEHQLKAVRQVQDFVAQLGLSVNQEIFPSPLRGEKAGNQEYFLCASMTGTRLSSKA